MASKVVLSVTLVAAAFSLVVAVPLEGEGECVPCAFQAGSELSTVLTPVADNMCKIMPSSDRYVPDLGGSAKCVKSKGSVYVSAGEVVDGVAPCEETTGDIITPVKCPMGIPNDDCSCGCQEACPEGLEHDDMCNCVCSNKCSEGQIQNEDCSCVCEGSCDAGFIFDQNCNCVCGKVCSATQIQTATCECECASTCPLGYTQTADCMCECTKECGDGYDLNQETCTCEKKPCPACLPGFALDEATCDCACKKECEPGYYLRSSETECKCVADPCDACPEGSVCLMDKAGQPVCRKCGCGFCDSMSNACCEVNAAGNNCKPPGGGRDECLLQKDNFPAFFGESGDACSGVEVSATATENGCGCKPNSMVPCTFSAGNDSCFVCRADELNDPACAACKACVDQCPAPAKGKNADYSCFSSCATQCIKTAF
eukprot:CAMPEP_0198309872 /NCGR_PEP_ID=MMETSP1450-20131203/2114_1 /TAXON_ID=753684 ORGANISM="Madagascaria erythrocladiodes, Strain CCMP3234" /NCGR_SAMPLE_ID=MMETSP1450 /ASSEMBLY_ACC=CAM_ASM_001115 /LENGTH=427 /DNA_ID=CAMNT_0044012653 /DNA_START=231 /DNA_END=1514 /DNA_ORIENTATION=-